jgi:hypothetical protein
MEVEVAIPATSDARVPLAPNTAPEASIALPWRPDRATEGWAGDGARGTRTPDLLGAIQALSQMSYSPGWRGV